MDDRALLEMAAKAAGEWPSPEPFEHVLARWNPLADDAAALRLAVKLRFVVCVRGHECEVFSEDEGECLASEPIWYASALAAINDPNPNEPYAATRRAIVRAAAAIGSSLSREGEMK